MPTNVVMPTNDIMPAKVIVPAKGVGTASPSDIERVIHELAAGQHGVVTRRQLLAAGVRPGAVARRVRSRHLMPIHRGVYRVGPVVAPRGREMAAVLACGETAAVSHESAADLWEVGGTRSGDVPVHVSVQAGQPAPRGVRVHRVRAIRPDEITTVEEIPVTTPARTLLDLSASAEARRLERAVAEAFARRLTSRSRVLRLTARYPRRPGIARLRVLLEAGTGPALTRSQAEERFLALVRKADLPEPEANVEIEGFEVDFLWRSAGLVAEIDGFVYHASRARFERDRRRDAVLLGAGFRVIRVTWQQLVRKREALIASLGLALGQGP